MTRDLAGAVGGAVPRETIEQLELYAGLLTAAAATQNLISAGSLANLWERHLIDSAQLARFEPRPGCSWVDVGSGAGLPGLVIAALVQGRVVLVEPRRLRATFLADCIERMNLSPRVSVICSTVEQVSETFDVITARALAPLDRLLAMTAHLGVTGSRWVLPKGRTAKSELAEARRNWHCIAREEQSCTDPDARILLLEDVRAKGK